jgi:hypothetical protein
VCGFTVEVPPGDEHYVEEGRWHCSSATCHKGAVMERPYSPVMVLEEKQKEKSDA